MRDGRASRESRETDGNSDSEGNSDTEGNQDLLYNSKADDADQEWMDKTQVPTDATLSCPMCFTLLCRDCQQHVEYKDQYRAMFTLNCNIIHSEVLQSKESEIYHPVECAECGCNVAVYDAEEVFHFFNVLATPCSR
jgi:hypothetical protein